MSSSLFLIEPDLNYKDSFQNVVKDYQHANEDQIGIQLL